MYNPLTSTVATGIEHSMSDRVKPSFVIVHIRALWCSGLRVKSVRMSKITNDGLTRSGTECYIAVPIMTTVGVKGLKEKTQRSSSDRLFWYQHQRRTPCHRNSSQSGHESLDCQWMLQRTHRSPVEHGHCWRSVSVQWSAFQQRTPSSSMSYWQRLKLEPSLCKLQLQPHRCKELRT